MVPSGLVIEVEGSNYLVQPQAQFHLRHSRLNGRVRAWLSQRCEIEVRELTRC